MTDGLKNAHRDAIIAALAANDRVERAVLFGSRATGTNTVTSDVDIALIGDRLTLTDRARLSAVIDQIPMAQTVDLLLYDSIRDQSLHDHIRNDGIEWFARPTRVAADPENWPTLRFKELLQGPVRNGIYKRKEYRGHGMKIVNMGELFAHPRLHAVPMKRVSLSKSERERFSVVEGDLLFARRSLVAEGAGRCCVVLGVDEPTTFESSIIRARPDPKRSDSLYLYYLFGSPLGLHLLDTIRRQVAVAGITGKDLSELTIPVPSPPQQRAIAQVLGTLDDKIELNRRMNETLEAMARALFKSWFVDFDPVRAKMEGRDTGLPQELADVFPDRLVDSELGEIPLGWKVAPLDEIARFQNGLALQKFRPAKDEARLPVVKIAQLRAGEANSGEWASAAIRPECIIEDGDVLFSWSGSLLVKTWCGGRAALNQHLFKVTSARYPKWFFLHSLLSHLRTFRRIAQDKATTMGHIRRHHLTEALCVAPPDDVVERLSGTFSCLLAQRVANELSSRTLAALRDTLLPQLISGELRVHRAEKSLGRAE